MLSVPAKDRLRSFHHKTTAISASEAGVVSQLAAISRCNRWQSDANISQDIQHCSLITVLQRRPSYGEVVGVGYPCICKSDSRGAAALLQIRMAMSRCDKEVSKTSLDGNVSKRKQGGHSVAGTGFGFSTFKKPRTHTPTGRGGGERRRREKTSKKEKTHTRDSSSDS
jgi:hypothetical protein